MANAVIRGMLIVIKAYKKKHERSQVKNLILHFKELEKEEVKPKVSRKEIRKIEHK